MDRILGQDIPEGQERKDFLDANSDAIEPISYTRRFSSDELLKKKDNLSTLDIELNDLEEEKKDIMDSFKEKMKPLTEDRKKLLRDLKDKSESVNRPCYKRIDHDERMVGFYNELGELVYSRPIQSQEMQRTIYNLQTGTND